MDSNHNTNETQNEVSETIMNETSNELKNDESMIEFLNDFVIKSKRLGHNKLQDRLEIYIQQLQSHENEIIDLKNTINELTKEKNIHVQLIEKQKNDLLTINNNYNDLLKKFNDINISLSNEKTTNNNSKLSYESQLQKSNKLNESLNIDLNYERKNNVDLHQKLIEFKTRYDELTAMYSKQIFDIDVMTRELKNAKDELNISSLNNKSIYNELQTIKNETNNYINTINDLKTQLTLQQTEPSVKNIQLTQKPKALTTQRKTNRR